MPTIREAYFEALKLGAPKPVVDFALKEVNGFDYLELTKHFDNDFKDYHRFIDAIKRYVDGEMIEYIFNKTYFLSLPFYVDKTVLIPRQETEQLVLLCKKMIEESFTDKELNIADVCCGSGAIGLSMASILSQHCYYLTDISKDALNVSKMNAVNLKILKNIYFLEGDMLQPFTDTGIKLDVIICNPPYISDVNTVEKRTWEQEPHLALLADPNTKYYEILLVQAKKLLNSKFLIAFEIGEDMENALTDLVKKYYPDCDFFFEEDMYGKTRFLLIKHQ